MNNKYSKLMKRNIAEISLMTDQHCGDLLVVPAIKKKFDYERSRNVLINVKIGKILFIEKNKKQRLSAGLFLRNISKGKDTDFVTLSLRGAIKEEIAICKISMMKQIELDIEY